MAATSSISRAVNLLNAFRANKSIPWGDTSFLLETEELDKLPRSHLRRHLTARNVDWKGDISRKTLTNLLQLSLDKEIEETRKREEEIEREHLRIARLEEEGAVYCVGLNHRGQLGLGDLEHRHVFTVIPETRGMSIKEVSTRNETVFAISESNRVYVWGAGGTGPMAIENSKRVNFESPQHVEELDEEDVTNIVVGLNHACAMSKYAVYSWGIGQSGCLGNGKMENQMLPNLISFPTARIDYIKEIRTGEMHCCALSNDGGLYTWGHGANGRLGQKDLQGIVNVPCAINVPERIEMIACGSEHTIAASISNVYSWGSNDGARLGHGDHRDRSSPCQIEALSSQGLHILDISCGTWHSACVALVPPSKNNGWLYTWGSGYCGQLALKGQTISMRPALVPFFCDNQIALKKIICGSHHNAAITSDGEMYTWGSNEQGCLGHEIDELKFLSFTSKPGYCPGFGAICGRIGRGLPISVAIGKGYTIVCAGQYNGPDEEEAKELLSL